MDAFFPTATMQHQPDFEVIEGGQQVPYSDVPDRVDRVLQALRSSGLAQPRPAPAWDSSLLTQLHSPDYLDFLRDGFSDWQQAGAQLGWASVGPLLPALSSPRRPLSGRAASLQSVFARAGYYILDQAAPLLAGTWTAALDSAGCAIAAAQAALDSGRSAFAICRPPGHHAGRDFAGGFCYLNNAGVAAQVLRSAVGARVAIVDIDYHAGHGTQDLFYDRADVVTLSLHADPAHEYPFFFGHADEQGVGPGLGFHRNLPLPLGIDDAGYLSALDAGLAWLGGHAPAALVVSAGLDLYRGDPVGRFAISRRGLAQIGGRLAALHLPTVVVLEGGYNVDELGELCVELLSPLST